MKKKYKCKTKNKTFWFTTVLTRQQHNRISRQDNENNIHSIVIYIIISNPSTVEIQRVIQTMTSDIVARRMRWILSRDSGSTYWTDVLYKAHFFSSMRTFCSCKETLPYSESHSPTLLSQTKRVQASRDCWREDAIEVSLYQVTRYDGFSRACWFDHNIGEYDRYEDYIPVHLQKDSVMCLNHNLDKEFVGLMDT